MHRDHAGGRHVHVSSEIIPLWQTVAWQPRAWEYQVMSGGGRGGLALVGARGIYDLGVHMRPEEVAGGTRWGEVGVHSAKATHLLLLEACEVPEIIESHLFPLPVLHEGGGCGREEASQGPLSPILVYVTIG